MEITIPGILPVKATLTIVRLRYNRLPLLVSTIIGCPGYAKFMAIPNYTYLKLKMPGPKGVITVNSSFEHAYECDVKCVEYGEAVESSTELASKLEALAAEAPEPKRHAGSFEPVEGTKKIPLDPDNSDGKVLTIGADLDPK